jgi:hypothetical protein
MEYFTPLVPHNALCLPVSRWAFESITQNAATRLDGGYEVVYEMSTAKVGGSVITP